MSHELFYTSAPQGLKPGSQGFCTVACTRGMTPVLAQLLETLSGYKPVYPAGHPQAEHNPVVYSHLRYEDAGRRSAILTRTAAAGLDYSRRGNSFSHHVVLSEKELPGGGPAWLLRQPGFLEPVWDGQVRQLESGRAPTQGDDPARPCRMWQQVTGDAGWGGVVAEACLVRPRQPVYLVFEPGMELLPLIAECLALMPPARRWGITFSTYFTGMPYGLECQIRGVLAGSQEHAKSRRETNVLVLDLTVPLSRAEKSDWAEAGRTGHPPAAPAPRRERAAAAAAAAPAELTDVDPAPLRMLEAVEARLSAPTPARPVPAPPLRTPIEPLPPAMPAPPPVPRLPPAPPARSGLAYLLFFLGIIAGLVLGALGMFLGLKTSGGEAKSSPPPPATSAPASAPGFWTHLHEQTWRHMRTRWKEEQAKQELDRQLIQKTESDLQEREKALAREREALRRAGQRGGPVPPAQERTELPVKQQHVNAETRTVYFDLPALESDKDYQFQHPAKLPLFRIGLTQVESPAGQMGSTLGMQTVRGPRDPVRALWWLRSPDDHVHLHLLGALAELSEPERRDFQQAVRAHFFVAEVAGGVTWVFAFRPFQTLPRLRLFEAAPRATVTLQELYAWEETRFVLRDIKLRDRSGFDLRIAPEKQTKKQEAVYLVANPLREGVLATIRVRLVITDALKPPELVAELTLLPPPAEPPTSLLEWTLREQEARLREELAVEIYDLAAGVEVGGVFCELARIDPQAPDDFQKPPKKKRPAPVVEEEEKPLDAQPPAPPMLKSTKSATTPPGQAVPAPNLIPPKKPPQ